jgi:DNA-binding Xre family transcriptional regulator
LVKYSYSERLKGEMPVINRVPELVSKKFDGKKINISDVSKEVKLSYPTTHEWLRGIVRRVDIEVLEKWCKYLGVQPGDILTYEED